MAGLITKARLMADFATSSAGCGHGSNYFAIELARNMPSEVLAVLGAAL